MHVIACISPDCVSAPITFVTLFMRSFLVSIITITVASSDVNIPAADDHDLAILSQNASTRAISGEDKENDEYGYNFQYTAAMHPTSQPIYYKNSTPSRPRRLEMNADNQFVEVISNTESINGGLVYESVPIFDFEFTDVSPKSEFDIDKKVQSSSEKQIVSVNRLRGIPQYDYSDFV